MSSIGPEHLGQDHWLWEPAVLIDSSTGEAASPIRCVLSMFSSLRVKAPVQPDGGEGLVMMQGLPLRGGV